MFTNFDVIFLMLLLHSIRQGSRMNVFSIKFNKKKLILWFELLKLCKTVLSHWRLYSFIFVIMRVNFGAV